MKALVAKTVINVTDNFAVIINSVCHDMKECNI